MASFFGLGIGSLLVRFELKLQGYVYLVVFCAITITPLLGNLFNMLSNNFQDNFWISLSTNNSLQFSPKNMSQSIHTVISPHFIILLLAFISNAAVFIVFGERIGKLFRELDSLFAYTVEIGGSILGILVFTIISFIQLSMSVKFIFGFSLLLCMSDLNKKNLFRYIFFVLLMIIIIFPYVSIFEWSANSKISFEPIDKVFDVKNRTLKDFSKGALYSAGIDDRENYLLWNSDKIDSDDEFYNEMKSFFHFPYKNMKIKGEVLIIGTAIYNDLAAAIDNNIGPVDGVERELKILKLEKKYLSEEVFKKTHLYVDDMRYFIKNSDKKYACIILTLYDVNNITSLLSNNRYGNFKYTLESLSEVKKMLLPGGMLCLSFSSQPQWLHERIIYMLDLVFNNKTGYILANKESKTILYYNYNNEDKRTVPTNCKDNENLAATDDWPFLFMQKKMLPLHYLIFIGLLIVTGFSSMVILPSGQRNVLFPYFFMGAAFFLVETSNITSLLLIYESLNLTNVAVFTLILSLVLLGNFTAHFMRRPAYCVCFVLLFMSIIFSYFLEPSYFLGFKSEFMKIWVGGVAFLSPVYFGSIIFANMIKRELNLYQAYGSNLLGAMIGGASEYLSLLFGIKFLLIITMIFYFCVFLYLRKQCFCRTAEQTI
ncbi:MAG: spermidine synthase-like protein [uncultured bacterium]|nr:MAG: spermidine synthase-like protein [uncultured bacterium]